MLKPLNSLEYLSAGSGAGSVAFTGAKSLKPRYLATPDCCHSACTFAQSLCYTAFELGSLAVPVITYDSDKDGYCSFGMTQGPCSFSMVPIACSSSSHRKPVRTYLGTNFRKIGCRHLQLDLMQYCDLRTVCTASYMKLVSCCTRVSHGFGAHAIRTHAFGLSSFCTRFHLQVCETT